MIHINTQEEIDLLTEIHQELNEKAIELGLAELKFVNENGTITFVPMLPPEQFEEIETVSDLHTYHPTVDIFVNGRANPRAADLDFNEECRFIGGDKGDLYFDGYEIEDNRTVLYKPRIMTTYDDLTQNEVNEIAQEILDFSFASIGFEAIE